MANDNGLVDEFEKLQGIKKELEEKIESIRRKIISLANEKNTEILFGTNKKCSVKSFAKIVYPEDKTKIVELIKNKGLYDKFSSINYLKLNSEISRGNVDKEIENLIRKEIAFRVSLMDMR